MILFIERADHWLRWIAAASWQLALFAALVGAVAWTTRWASPRWRHALWLLVLLKALLPPSLTAVWGIGAWGVAPLWRQAEESGLADRLTAAASLDSVDVAMSGVAVQNDVADAATLAAPSMPLPFTTLLFVAWLAGCLIVAGMALYRYAQLRRATRRMQLIDEGPLRISLERIALALNQRHAPDLYASETASSPYLFGVVHPTIVAPRELLAQDATAVHAVLLHEMHHWRRRDPWIGWLQVVVQTLFWFHPLVWWANARLRAEREAACDEAVLRTGACPPADYGKALLDTLSLARGRSFVHGNMTGVFERGADLQTRLEAIMNFQPDRPSFGALSQVALAALALVLLPMGMPTGQQSLLAKETKSPPREKKIAPNSPPTFVSTPKAGATDVDPALKEIVLKFDRDMGGGMSWTGGPPDFPPVDDAREPKWRDKRTCVLPVKLKKGAYYRVGVNSTSFQNFRSESGIPADPGAVFFTTEGAKPQLVLRVKSPVVVKAEPALDATDVDPDTMFLKVTFDIPMGGGMSWTGKVPSIEGQRGRWSRDARSCIIPVELEPNKSYVIGLNSQSHMNFQSKWGVPLEPVVYKFTTAKKSDAKKKK